MARDGALVSQAFGVDGRGIVDQEVVPLLEMNDGVLAGT